MLFQNQNFFCHKGMSMLYFTTMVTKKTLLCVTKNCLFLKVWAPMVIYHVGIATRICNVMIWNSTVLHKIKYSFVIEYCLCFLYSSGKKRQTFYYKTLSSKVWVPIMDGNMDELLWEYELLLNISSEIKFSFATILSLVPFLFLFLLKNR